ncbi:helix-turn-helix domain-containing protein [Acuticoccus mangrovi]|uniref:Helix-turn-helix transcriptional regulator n=1 Tax=Acuticoccus mangrovi TaxID=2796142 RepID=A0A934MMG1_9HYPH|nr:helix-turn-helix transcriptional regulator [Acuticoccus mangrovi]MBJ3777239.1 helix-turn-helix transcriptional regulator [Acuticoccus mangrovi]
MAPRKQPNPIDVHVGSRLKLRRTMLGMTQEKLGDQLGVTFQQVQKYEKGANRIGASRLQEISQILDVPVAFFFEDARQPADDGLAGVARASGFAEDAGSAFAVPRAPANEAHELARAFSRIDDARIRRRIIDLVETLADAHRH